MTNFIAKYPVVPNQEMYSNQKMDASWNLYHMQANNYIQTNLGPEGHVVPSLTTAEIALLTTAQNGTLIHNTTTNELQVRKAGVFKNVLTT